MFVQIVFTIVKPLSCMKKFYLLVIFVLLAIASSKGQNLFSLDAKWQNPLPQGGFNWDIKFTNAQNGWVVGERGYLMHTTDGGAHWVAKNIEGHPGFTCSFWLNDLTGWAAGRDARLIKTTDGGNNWQDVQILAPVQNIYDIFFLNDSLGWVAMGPCDNIFRTTDGGLTWSASEFLVGNNFYTGIHFLNPQKGFVLGGWPGLLQTSDGGATWHSSPGSPSGGEKIKFLDSLNGWMGGLFNEFYRTTNGGLDWTTIYCPGKYMNLSFIKPLEGWIIKPEMEELPGSI
jgi:photosystem II stability/assembly factor-like uncharacterized protein